MTSLEQDPNLIVPPPQPEQFIDYAAENGVVLDDDRLNGLMNRAQVAFESGSTRGFKKDGLIIFKPVAVETETGSHKVATIDFIPPHDYTKFKGGGATTRQVGKATEFMLNGIAAIQDYLILVETGYLAKPDELAKMTNDTMAVLATRLGFKESEEGDKVSVEYPELLQKAFSSEIVGSTEMLKRRQTRLAESAGTVAVTSS